MRTLRDMANLYQHATRVSIVRTGRHLHESNELLQTLHQKETATSACAHG
jgi:hypothetical protein